MDPMGTPPLAALSLTDSTDSCTFLDLPSPAISAVARHLPTTQCLQLGREILPKASRAAAAVLGSIRRLALQVPHGAAVTLPTHLENLQELVLEPLPVNPHKHQPHIYRKACKLLGLTDDQQVSLGDIYVPDDDAYDDRDDTLLCNSLAQLTQLTGLTLLLPYGDEAEPDMDIVWTQNRLQRQSVSQVCEALGHLTNLRRLSAKYLNPSDDDMMHLTTVINLEYLDISTHGSFCGPAEPGPTMFHPPIACPTAPASSLYPAGAAPIAGLTNLQWLNVSGHMELRTDGISQLSTLTNLTSLNMNRTHGGRDAVAALEPVLHNLVELGAAKVCRYAADDKQVAAALAPGLNADKLRVLDLSGDSTAYYMISTIAGLSMLQELHVHELTEVSDAAQRLQELAAVLRNLTALRMSRSNGVFPLFTSILVQLTGLQHLQLPSMSLGVADLAVVCQTLTNLTTLDVNDNPQAVAANSCKHLSCLQQLQRLSLHGCVFDDAEPELSVVLASQFVSMQQLSQLVLTGRTSASVLTGGLDWEVLLPALAKVSSLRELRLSPLGGRSHITFGLLLQLTQLHVLELPCVGAEFEYVLDVQLLKSAITNLSELHFLAVGADAEF